MGHFNAYYRDCIALYRPDNVPIPINVDSDDDSEESLEESSRGPFTRETLLMELLTAEHSDEELDDRELEGSGDDYDG